MERIDELREEQESISTELEKLRTLRSDPAYITYTSMLKDQERALRYREFSLRVDTLDKAFQIGDMRGEIAGLQFSINLIDKLILDLDDRNDAIRNEISEWHRIQEQQEAVSKSKSSP